MAAVQEREQELVRRLETRPVNERIEPRVVYKSSAELKNLLAAIATAGSSEALVAHA